MKASELRIGNWVYSNAIHKPFQVDIGTLKHIGEMYMTNPPKPIVEPIPLNEEWLVKFGFKGQQVYESVSDYWIPDGYRTKGHKVQTDGETFVFMGYKDGIEIDYVHQLQNLYFALTGEELTIK